METIAQPDLGTRFCSGCKEAKPATLEFFYRHKADKLQSWCKACHSRARAERHKNPGRVAPPRPTKGITGLPKACVKCGEFKPDTPEFFGPARKSLRADCRACERERHRKRQERVRAQRTPDEKEQVRQRQKEYAAKNFVALRANSHRHRALRRAVPGSWTGHDIRDLFIRQKSCCLYCGIRLGWRGAKWHIDHFVPISRGGSNFPENLVLACAFCNLSKHDKMPWEFMPEKFSPPDQQAAD